jgi:superfamily II DNA or RNA helicase
MQISSTRDDDAVRSGDLVLVRRARWRIVHIHRHGHCQVITLRGMAPPYLDLERRFLLPFERVEQVARTPRTRFVRLAPWRRALRSLVADEAPPGSLRAARSSRIDLLPHQLEPAMAILRGLATRILIADEVGLGKTIQAALIASELLTRRTIERVLVLTPPGLREQWLGELADRFAIAAVGADGPALRRRAATMPLGVNPWHTLGVAVASIDYVKRPEVLPAVQSRPWDLVILDEAHACAGDSDRHAAAHALAASASFALLLSATPHNGDRESFSALCAIGDVDGAPLLVFRRTRTDVRTGAVRHVHIIRVKPSRDEARMHAMLGRYRDALQAEGTDTLALAVLHKRALSSAWSLAVSVERRLATLAVEDRSVAAQMTLPLFDPHGDFIAADEAPAWPADLRLKDLALERRLLTALHERARSAIARETKVAALLKLLRRTRQSAVVFTEYRDTLRHLRQVLESPALELHGGLSRDERSAVLAAFARDPCGLLLTTDAAAEGLNLHHHCCLVVNLELPWNPMRIEQRIGRVDRIGQRRTVHAFHLIAAGTGETRLLAHLRARVARAKADLGAPDPLDDERHIARLVLKGRFTDDPDDSRSATRSDCGS